MGFSVTTVQAASEAANIDTKPIFKCIVFSTFAMASIWLIYRVSSTSRIDRLAEFEDKRLSYNTKNRRNSGHASPLLAKDSRLMRWAEFIMLKFVSDECGATAIEYGMILAGVSVAMSVALVGFSEQFTIAADLIVGALGVI